MKLVPVLILTNALALGACLWLFFEQQGLEDRLAGARAAPTARAPATDPALVARLDTLERELEQRRARERALEDALGGAPLPAGEGLADGGGGPEDGPRAGMGGLLAGLEEEALAEGEEPAGALDLGASSKMESFRRLVRRASDLNEEEDRLRDVVGRLDRMIESSRIGPLDEQQKVAVARTVLGVRSSLRDRMRQVGETTDLRSLPREQRREVFMAEMDKVRVETQRELERQVPAPDAKQIADTTFGGSGGFWGGGRGPGGGGRTRPGR